ncbi:MAG: glycosyltransferase [Alphaproteobacteria bacterium]
MNAPTPPKPLHIAFGVDRNYAPAMGVTIISVVANNPQTDFVFHVFAEFLPPEDLEIIERLAQQLKTSINVHTLQHQTLSSIYYKKLPNFSIYYRLFLCEILKDVAEHVLYLDSDIVSVRAIPPFPELGEAVIAVVLDADQEDRNTHINRPALTPYFNSGVMYINVQRWNANNTTNKTLDILGAPNTFRFPDQDALNIVLADKVVWLDEKWNRMRNTASSIDELPADTVFLHYAGDKPWHAWRPIFLDPPFAKYFERSPWPVQRLLAPQTRKNKLQYARHLFKRGHLPQAVLWYLRFLSTPRKSSGQ